MLLYMTDKRTKIYFSRQNIAQIYNIRENGLIYNKTLPLYTQKKNCDRSTLLDTTLFHL